VDNVINKIYSHESVGITVNVNKFSNYVTSENLMKKLIGNLDPIESKGFSALLLFKIFQM